MRVVKMLFHNIFQRVGKIGGGKRFDRGSFLLLFHVLFQPSLVVAEIGLAEWTAETHNLILFVVDRF